jgi:metal-responsive CopG/Arc/MetJ family transcriptional regulator
LTTYTLDGVATSTDTRQRSSRVTVAVRLSEAGRDEIDAMANAEQRTRSQMVRILLGEAVAARRNRKLR